MYYRPHLFVIVAVSVLFLSVTQTAKTATFSSIEYGSNMLTEALGNLVSQVNLHGKYCQRNPGIDMESQLQDTLTTLPSDQDIEDNTANAVRWYTDVDLVYGSLVEIESWGSSVKHFRSSIPEGDVDDLTLEDHFMLLLTKRSARAATNLIHVGLTKNFNQAQMCEYLVDQSSRYLKKISSWERRYAVTITPTKKLTLAQQGSTALTKSAPFVLPVASTPLNDLIRTASINEQLMRYDIGTVDKDFESSSEIQQFIDNNSSNTEAITYIRLLRQFVSESKYLARDSFDRKQLISTLVQEQDNVYMSNIKQLPPNLRKYFFASTDCNSVLAHYCDLGKRGKIKYVKGDIDTGYVYRVSRD